MENRNKTIEDLHDIYNLETVNVRMYRALKKLWDKMRRKEPNIYSELTEENNSIFNDHKWWNRPALFLEREESEPVYT